MTGYIQAFGADKAVKYGRRKDGVIIFNLLKGIRVIATGTHLELTDRARQEYA